MSLRERLIELTRQQEELGVPLGSCCLHPEKHGADCRAGYARAVHKCGHAFNEKQVEAAMSAIPQIWRNASRYYSGSSYHLKHQLKDWWTRHRAELGPDAPFYIANGNFIAAMILLGFEWRVSPHAWCNAKFKLLYVKTKRERDRSRSPRGHE